MNYSSADFVPGNAPSPIHPRGTVFVTAYPPGDDSFIREYDLATGAIVGSLKFHTALAVARRSSSGLLHVLEHTFNAEISYVAVSPSPLKVLRRIRLGWLHPSGLNAFSTDGRLTVVLVAGCRDPDDPRDKSALFAASLDAEGRLIARRVLEREPAAEDSGSPSSSGIGAMDSVDMRDNLAVSGGVAFLLLANDDHTLDLLMLRPDLSVVKRVHVPGSEHMVSGLSRLRVEGKDVIVEAEQSGAPPVALAFQSDLSASHPVPFTRAARLLGRPDCGDETVMHGLDVGFCPCGKGSDESCLKWSPASPTPRELVTP